MLSFFSTRPRGSTSNLYNSFYYVYLWLFWWWLSRVYCWKGVFITFIGLYLPRSVSFSCLQHPSAVGSCGAVDANLAMGTCCLTCLKVWSVCTSSSPDGCIGSFLMSLSPIYICISEEFSHRRSRKFCPNRPFFYLRGVFSPILLRSRWSDLSWGCQWDG